MCKVIMGEQILSRIELFLTQLGLGVKHYGQALNFTRYRGRQG